MKKPQVTIIDTIPLPRGIAGLSDGNTIWLNPHLTAAGRRCTLEHELVHIERGIAPKEYEAREERTVDRIAAARLTPLSELLDSIIWHQGEGTRGAIAETLGVDIAMLQARLEIVTDAERQAINHALADLPQIP